MSPSNGTVGKCRLNSLKVDEAISRPGLCYSASSIHSVIAICNAPTHCTQGCFLQFKTLQHYFGQQNRVQKNCRKYNLKGMSSVENI